MDDLTQAMASASVSVPQFAPQPNCLLLKKLPGELRNKIIRLAVVENTDIKPSISRSYSALTGKSTRKLQIEHNLMQTCKQLRRETAEIYFLENTFNLTGDFFELVRGEKHKANEKAIQGLSRAFGPWASKVRRLNVLHAVSYGSLFAEVHVSICRAQGEPGVCIENVSAHDVGSDSRRLCCCSIIQHGADNSAAGIFEFAQGLVGMMDSVSVTGGSSLPHCWNCGLEPMS
jgi:hypothetical protein